MLKSCANQMCTGIPNRVGEACFPVDLGREHTAPSELFQADTKAADASKKLAEGKCARLATGVDCSSGWRRSRTEAPLNPGNFFCTRFAGRVCTSYMLGSTQW